MLANPFASKKWFSNAAQCPSDGHREEMHLHDIRCRRALKAHWNEAMAAVTSEKPNKTVTKQLSHRPRFDFFLCE